MGHSMIYESSKYSKMKPKELFVHLSEKSKFWFYIMIICKEEKNIINFHNKYKEILEDNISTFKGDNDFTYENGLNTHERLLEILDSFDDVGYWSMSIDISEQIRIYFPIDVSCQVSYYKLEGNETLDFAFHKQYLTDPQISLLNEEFGLELKYKDQY